MGWILGHLTNNNDPAPPGFLQILLDRKKRIFVTLANFNCSHFSTHALQVF
jgi:hypothetical protein